MTIYIPSSISATVPSTLTWRISPLAHNLCPISHTSSGSLSPFALVLGSTWLGSSQVYKPWHHNPYTHIIIYLRQGTIIPDISVIWKTIINKSYFTLLNILHDWIQRFRYFDLQYYLYTSRDHYILYTSILALVHRGISTIILTIEPVLSVYSGISWNGDT